MSESPTAALTRQQAQEQPSVACARKKLSRSFPVCLWNLLRLLPRLVPCGFFVLLLFLDVIQNDASDMTTHLVLAIALLGWGMASFEGSVDLPPLKWRKRAKRSDVAGRRRWKSFYNAERGDDDGTFRFRCPGCEAETDWPSEAVKYRCRAVEYEVRGGDLWLAAAVDGAAGATAQSEGEPRTDTGGVELVAPETGVPTSAQPVTVSRPAEWKVWTLWGLLVVLFVGIYLCFAGSPLAGATILVLCLITSVLTSTLAAKTTDTAPTRSPEASTALEKLSLYLESQRSELSDDAWARLVRIKAVLQEALPRLTRAEQQTPELLTMREAAEKLVPDAIAKYVALPRDFREREPLLDGRTARENLSAQLTLLERELEEARFTSLHAQSHELLVHGAYLKGRFPEDGGEFEALGPDAGQARGPRSEL